jgi:hypothetical protein
VLAYLGMTLYYTSPGKVQIIMSDYIKGILDDLPNDMDGEAPTPAVNHHFDVNANHSQPLSCDEAELFHHVAAQLLFLCKRSHPDIQRAFSVHKGKNPDIDDYKKLNRVIK